jgi:CBS domain-containing protein
MDVMTMNVITVDPETSVQALATLLSERSISGVPVVDRDHRLLGIVTEGDLLHRAETGTERRTQRRRRRWLDAFATDQEAARDYVKSHGRTVREIMTQEVISVSDTTDLAEIATLLETKRIKRVPVLRDGKLVGIVSRANLVRALAMTKSEPAVVADSDDHTSAQNCSPNSRDKSGFTCGPRTSSSATGSSISGSPTTDPRTKGRRCGLPPRTSRECRGSKNTSCPLP